MEERLTREEAEKQICELLEWIREIHGRYNPHADYLSLAVHKNHVTANNAYWDGDINYPIDFYKIEKE